MSSSKINRKFERFIFNGIPEYPEPIWERDANTIVTVRYTGMSQEVAQNNFHLDASEDIGYFTYDFENETEEFIETTHHNKSK